MDYPQIICIHDQTVKHTAYILKERFKIIYFKESIKQIFSEKNLQPRSYENEYACAEVFIITTYTQ